MPSSASKRSKKAKDQAKSDLEAILAAAATGTLANLSGPSSGGGASLGKAAAESSATAATIAAIIAALATARAGTEWLEELMRPEFEVSGDEAVSDQEITAAANLEIEREREFLANMRKRLERDIPDALGQPDPVAAVNTILEREQRYMEQHDDAAAARAHAAIRRGLVRRVSPEGAYWVMSPAVKEHTPDCIAMAAVGWWPWSVLDAINPPVHTGCQCDLLTKNQAIGLGYLEMDFEPMSEAEARDRAKAIQQRYGLEEAWRRWPPLDKDDLMEVRWNRRYAKGTIWGGRFMPRRGGFAPRISIRDILRRLMGPDAPPVAARGGQATASAPDPGDIGRGMSSPGKRVNPEKMAEVGQEAVLEAQRTLAARIGAAAGRHNGTVTPFEIKQAQRDPRYPDEPSVGGERLPSIDGSVAEIRIGEVELRAIYEEAAAREAGLPISDQLRAAAYNGRRTLAHELIHNASAIDLDEYWNRPDAFALEEALTEELAHMETIEQLLAAGDTETLAFLQANPDLDEVRGVYLPQREGLGVVLDYAQVPEDERRALLERLSMGLNTTDERISELAKLVSKAQGVSQERAIDIVRGALFDYGSRAGRNYDIGVEMGGSGRQVLAPNLNMVEPGLGFAEGDMVRVTNVSEPYVGKVITAKKGADGKPLLTLEVPNLDADGRKMGVAFRNPDPDSIEKVADAPRKQLKGNTVTGRVKVGDTVMVTQDDGSMFKGTLERIAAMTKGGEFAADIRRDDGIVQRVRDTSVRNIRRATANDRPKVPAPPKPKKQPIPGGARRVKPKDVSGPRGYDPRRHQDPRRGLLNKTQALPAGEELLVADGSIITKGKHGSVVIERPDGSRRRYATPQRMANAESEGIEKRVGPKKGMASPADGNPDERTSLAFQLDQDAALDRLEQAGMRSPGYRPEDNPEHDIDVGNALMEWVEDPNQVYSGLDALKYDVTNGRTLSGPFFRGQAVEHLAPPESGRFRGWSYDLEIAIDFARRGPEVRGSGGTRRRERTTNVDLSPDEELVISIYKADSGVGVDINDRLAEIAEENSGLDEEKVSEIRAEAEEEQIWELVNDRITEETGHYDRAKQILIDEFDTDWAKLEQKREVETRSDRLGLTYVMADAITALADDEREAFFGRLDESFEPPPNQDTLPGIDPPEQPESYVESFRDYMDTAEENANYTIEYDEYGDIRTNDFENPYGHEREAILDNDQMDGYERIDVVIAKGQDDDATSIRARVEDALENPDSIYRARPFSELTEPDPDELADIEAEMAGAVEETESEALAAVGMASPSRNGYQRQLTNEEVALKGMASPAGLDRLKDGEGPVEMRLRAALDAIGLDPYDVDLDALDAHAAIHEAEPKSRLEVAGQGISPCAFSRKVDYAVHVLLPEMLAEKYPRIAKQLRDTSPRWGHRTGQKPLGLARPAVGMASPGRDDGWTPPPTPPELVPLESRLLEIGGKRFVARDEPDLEKILERGYLREDGNDAQLVNGVPNQCHGNAAYLWERGEADIVTGYSLSEDGLWRQHSWGEKDGEIIETTSKREKYYGVRLTDEEAAQFAADNPDGYVERGMASPSRRVNEDAMLPKGRRVEVGGTPFRPEDADDPEGFSRKQRDYQRRYSQVAEAFGVEGVTHTEQKGVWSGEAEPSVATDLGDVDNETALATAAVLGQHYEQEAMAVFAPDDNGPGARFAVRIPDGMSDDDVLERISRGMPEGEGASVLDGEAYFYAHDWRDGQQAAESLAEAFDSDWEAERGTFTLISDEDYGDITYEQALGQRAAEAREVRTRWEQEDRSRGQAADTKRGESAPQEVSGPVAFSRRTEVLTDGLHEVFSAQQGDEPIGYLGISQYGGDVWVETGEVSPDYDPNGVLSALMSEVARNYPDGDIYIGAGVEDSADQLEAVGAKRAEMPEGMRSPGFPMMKRLFKLKPEKKKEIERSLLEKPPEPVQGIPDYEAVELTDVKGAGGSNDARIAVDANGNSWLLKAYRGDSDRVATELLANAIYRELGVTVSNAGVGINRHPQFGDQIAVAYPLIAGDIRQWNTPNAELGEGFVADALLANWDVIGLTQDNVLWNGDTPIRLDQGGTLAFRAMGGRKPYGPVPTEMWTMRDERGQANGTMDITEAGLIAQARDVALRLTPERIDALVDAAPFADDNIREEVRAALKERVAWLDRFSRGEEKMPEPLEGDEVLDFFADRDASLETMPTEDAALEAYFGDLGSEIDDHLQSGKRKDAASAEVRQAITELDMVLGIEDTKLDEALIVHVPIPSVNNPQQLIGNWVTERSFLPAELDQPMSGTSVRLKVPSGTNAIMPAALGLDSGEGADILLPRNSRVKVTGVTETDSGLILDAVLKPAPSYAYKPAKPLSSEPIAKPTPMPEPPDPQPPTPPPPPKGMASPGADRSTLIADRVDETLKVWGPEAEIAAQEIVDARLTDRPDLDTESYFTDVDGTYLPERAVLHRQQLDFMRGDTEPVPEGETPKAIFMSGGSAAGKGTLLGEGVIEQPDDIVHVDADEFKELIPEYQVLKQMGEDESIEGVDIADAAPIVHEESSFISKVASADAIATRRNVLIDAVGGSASYMRRIEEARDAGHDVEVNLVVNNPDRAFEQAAERAEEMGRSVPLFAIYGSHRNVSRTFDDEWQDEDAEGNPIGEPHKPLTARGVPGKVYDGRTRELIATWDADGNVTVLNQEVYDEWRAIGERPHPANDPEMPARNARAQELLAQAKERRAKRREMAAQGMASPGVAFAGASGSGITVGSLTPRGERAPELVEVADREITRIAGLWPGLADVAFYLIDDEETQMMAGNPGQNSPEGFIVTPQGNPIAVEPREWPTEELTPAAFARRALYGLDGGRGGARKVDSTSFHVRHSETPDGERLGRPNKPHTVVLDPNLLGDSDALTVGGRMLAMRTGESLWTDTVINGKTWGQHLKEAKANLKGRGGETWKDLRQFGSRLVDGKWKDGLDLSESDFPATREDLAAAFATTVLHEIGHAVGAEIAGEEQNAADYRKLFEEFEITPQEIATVSPYATVHPAEAFAEIYAMFFSEMIAEMDMNLRLKFAKLLRERLPEHQIPESLASIQELSDDLAAQFPDGVPITRRYDTVT